MSDYSNVTFKCLNTCCAKPIKVKRPQRTGVYEVTCPYCHITKKMKIVGIDDMQQPDHPGQDAACPAASDGETAPDYSDKDPVALTDDFLVDTDYSVECPHCHKQKIGFNSVKQGLKKFQCPYCQGRITAEVRKTTEVVSNTESVQMYEGRLVMLRYGLFNKNFALRQGRNIIGRYDEDAPSDISVKNDSNMSRRSVEIDVSYTDRGYMFRLTVLNATNPVLHNDKPLMRGESVSLNFGDSIVMGKTRFRFEKIEK